MSRTTGLALLIATIVAGALTFAAVASAHATHVYAGGSMGSAITAASPDRAISHLGATLPAPAV